jgi:hypothetical protein
MIRSFPAARSRPLARLVCSLGALALIAGCASTREAIGPMRKETVHAVTASHRLITFNAGQPQKILSKKPLGGLAPDESIVGIDYRVARGQLYALSDRGRLFRITPATGALEPVGVVAGLDLRGKRVGFDVNPAVDRIRVVTEDGVNLRLHPDTGAQIDGDASAAGVQPDTPLAYAAGDTNAGSPARVVAAAYTYDKTDRKTTTSFALDAAYGTLVTQGSREGATAAVSPNTGRLATVGPLKVPTFSEASFDIGDVSNEPFAALAATGEREPRWYSVSLVTGAATFIGTVRSGEPLRGIAIAP